MGPLRLTSIIILYTENFTLIHPSQNSHVHMLKHNIRPKRLIKSPKIIHDAYSAIGRYGWMSWVERENRKT